MLVTSDIVRHGERVMGLERVLFGLIVGAAGGYLYHRTVGCSTGACPITANPWISTGYGAMLGYIFTT